MLLYDRRGARRSCSSASGRCRPRPSASRTRRGRVLAEDAARRRRPAAVSAAPRWTGSRVRAADTPGRLPVASAIAAGRPAGAAARAGRGDGDRDRRRRPRRRRCRRSRRVRCRSDNGVEIAGRPSRARQRPAAIGGDVRAGELVLAAGACARSGADRRARCRRRRRGPLRAAPAGRRPQHRHRAAPAGRAARRRARSTSRTRPMLAAALAGGRRGGRAARRRSPTSRGRHRAALERGLEADVLVSSGGVSVGPHDLVRRIGAELGRRGGLLGRGRQARQAARVRRARADARLRAARQPGLGARRGRALRPARRRSRSRAPRTRPPRTRVGRLATRRFDASADRDQLVRARSRLEDGETVLEPLSGQESHMIARAAAADALVLVRRGERDPPQATGSASCGSSSPPRAACRRRSA